MSNTLMPRSSSRFAQAANPMALIAVIGAAFGVAGCSSSGSTGPRTGSLAVTVTAAGGVTPNVMVSGPGGYNKVLSATTTLTGLASGSYTVTAAPVTIAAPIVGTVHSATVVGSPAGVTAGATAAATVTYAQRPGSGGLWIGDVAATTLLQYTAAQLGSTTSTPPASAIGTGTANSGVAFDASGNLWVTLAGHNSVVEYTASQLGASGTPTPAVTLSANSGSLNSPGALAFDASGNLWVANSGSTVVEFTVSQLASNGSPPPTVILSASGGSLNGPSGLAFDASGNLWVVNQLANSVVEFTAGQFASSGSPTPAVTLSASSGSLSHPFSPAFDASGNLWVTNGGNSTVVAFAPVQLVTGAPTPAVILGGLNGPIGMAFDASGDLWVANFGDGSVVEFTPTQLVNGTPTPNVTVSGSSLTHPYGLAFDPHAAGLPLKP